MHFKKLGMSDLNVSSYCLGTMTFGETTSEDDGHNQIDKSLEYGINFFDTAEMYQLAHFVQKLLEAQKLLLEIG